MKSSRKDAFTLIEVLLAILILAIGLVVLVESAGRCLAVIKAARYYEDARHLLARVEVEHPIDFEEFDEGTESGKFDGRWGDYRWKRVISSAGEEEDGLFEVKTQISWSERSGESREEIITLLYVPDAIVEGSF
jgi:prepilin-type N-terminal cleavage/methylation domain-containing protein